MPFSSDPQVERRLTLRLLSYWEKLRRGRQLPAEADITSDDIKDLWEDCFILRIDGQGKANMHYIGPKLAAILKDGLDTQDPILLQDERKTTWLGQMQASLRPLLYEGEIAGKDGKAIRFRQCLLPLGEEGRLTAVLGAMRAKVI